MGDLGGPVVTRFCIIEACAGGTLASVATTLGEYGVNIVGNTCKTRGKLLFQVVDVELCAEAIETVRKLISDLDGVIKCNIGSFSLESGEIYVESAPVRLCLVNENVPGVLGEISHLLGVEHRLTIVSQVNRSRGEMSYNVFDVENDSTKNFSEICRQLENLPQVRSCTMGHFKAGDLAGLTVKAHSSKISEASSGASSINLSPTPDLGQQLSVTPTGFVEKGENAVLSTNSLIEQHLNQNLENVLLQAHPSTETVVSVPEAPAVDYYEGSKQVLRPKPLSLMHERKLLTQTTKLVIVMVGLPARGKSFTARKLKRFLCWKHNNARIFNAGQYRRERISETPQKIHMRMDSFGIPPNSPRSPRGHASTDSADFFNQHNETGQQIRKNAAGRCLSDLLRFLKVEGGDVGIFDATNSTAERREWIAAQCKGIASLVFIEVICDDEEVLVENLLSKIRNSPDFHGLDEQTALTDLKSRIENYEKVYETLSNDEDSYIKIYNMNSRILANRIYGRVTRSLLPYMLSLHVGLRPIWFVRAGLADDADLTTNVGDEPFFPSTESKGSQLSEDGVAFSKRLARWIQTAVWVRDEEEDDSEIMIENEISYIGTAPLTDLPFGSPPGVNSIARAFGSNPDLVGSTARTDAADALDTETTATRIFDRGGSAVVRKGDGTRQRGAKVKCLTSTLPRAEQTAKIALELLADDSVAEVCPVLNPLDKGTMGGLSMEAIKRQNPEFFQKWTERPYHQRFTGGESYYDLVTRLEPVLVEIEQQTAPILVVSHISCIQVLLAYFLGIPVEKAMEIKVPMHTLLEVQPNMGGSWELTEYEI
mmetsp:Transcript_11429/g.18607  ORF Transcript_11429/g.18607 Transcript_11429/m.18607 type:complete len:824 (-) Transcript_11429:42-2513(-)|eukprot:CAMPEP_0203758710 /NCGR_PEP_ID=MMETSP0098-20131031/11534_1 /ASSEMBLY_ACC=CAM_ASM_000208 /TAXON_ID=96639 /ORGANISM=" , Strain NY0313808BC1" /LENGTH=823 /DNA_ID=CAMNT_0050651255 /DNA_START=2955 /DNA_END=5426 /DNA_ORIENTATION=+